MRSFDTNDALYDLAWSEINENQLIVACGDGSLKLFDIGVDEFPVMNFHEHKRETFSVAWSPVTKDTFISSSWDGTVKIVTDPSTPLSISRNLEIEMLTTSSHLPSGVPPETTLSKPSPSAIAPTAPPSALPTQPSFQQYLQIPTSEYLTYEHLHPPNTT